MLKSNTVDIIIPSFRLEEDYLLPLIELPKPDGWQFNYFIIVDNPSIKVPISIQNLANEGTIKLFINSENLGASASRNKGIDSGNAEWILFLDDDIVADQNLLQVYTKAMYQYPEEIGFIGLTDFPPAHNKFTCALEVGELTFFKVAEIKDQFPWGVTANMVYNRSKMGDLRFSPIFPKSGGGEDVDLPLRICKKHQKEFKCIKEARVVHPWWNNSQPHFDRFIRYGVGVGYLMPLHKELVLKDFPNTIESLFLLILSTPLFVLFGHWPIWIALLIAIPLFELIVVFLKSRDLGISSLKTIYYVTLLRNSFNLGLLKTVFIERQLQYFMSRINIGAPKTHNFRLNRWKTIKISLFIILFIIFKIAGLI